MATKFLKDKKVKDLNEIAELTNLPSHKGLKKDELVSALDSHLQTNATTYEGRSELSGYYDNKKSPVKKQIDRVIAAVTSDEDKSKAKSRRKTTSAETTSNEPEPATPKDLTRRKSSSMLAAPPIGSSPNAVADLVDQGRRRVASSLSSAYEKSQVEAWAHWARDNMSSAAAINLITIFFEAWYLRAGILPFKKAFDLPILGTKERFDVPAPDLFVLLTPEFWAPFTLWLLTSAVLPTAVASLLNISLKASSSHGYGTRRATAPSNAQPDPLIFFIAKALIAYVVYHNHALAGLYSNFTIAAVNESQYAGYSGMVVAAGIGAIVSLYEAVLKK